MLRFGRLLLSTVYLVASRVPFVASQVLVTHGCNGASGQIRSWWLCRGAAGASGRSDGTFLSRPRHPRPVLQARLVRSTLAGPDDHP